MNKRGQIPPQVLPIIGAFIFIVFIFPALLNTITSTSCQNEKAEISRLQGLLYSCQNSNAQLQNSLNSCILELNNSNEKCNEIIQNVTNEYNLKLQENYLINIFQYKFKIFLLWLSIPLALLSISFSIKFGKGFEIILFAIKIIIWCAYLIILFVSYHDFFKAFFGF